MEAFGAWILETFDLDACRGQVSRPFSALDNDNLDNLQSRGPSLTLRPLSQTLSPNPNPNPNRGDSRGAPCRALDVAGGKGELSLFLAMRSQTLTLSLTILGNSRSFWLCGPMRVNW